MWAGVARRAATNGSKWITAARLVRRDFNIRPAAAYNWIGRPTSMICIGGRR